MEHLCSLYAQEIDPILVLSAGKTAISIKFTNLEATVSRQSISMWPGCTIVF